MRTRLMPSLVLLCLVVPALPARAAEEKGLPAIVVRMKSLDGLVDDFRYLAELAEKENEAKQFEGLFKGMVGKNGLEGIDTKKPLALYGRIGPNVADSEVVLMVPIADEKAFLALLERTEIKAEKNKDGVYTASGDKLKELKQTVYFRFANGYAYITFNDAGFIAKDKVLLPAQVLPTDKLTTLSVTLSIDQIPVELRQIVLGQLELQMGKAKEEAPPNETKVQRDFRYAAVDEVTADVKSLLTDGQDLSLSIDVDRKSEDIALAMTLSGKSGSTLATNFADLGKAKSIGAGLIGSDSAMNVLAHLMISDKLRKALTPVIDEGFKKALADEKDDKKRAMAAKLLKVVEPSLKAGELDFGLNLRGPNANGFYAGVGALKVKDGKALENALKDLLKDASAEDKKDLTLDFEKVKEVSIHRVKPGKDYTEDAKKVFGDNPAYFAFRDDALFLSMGEGGLTAIKEAIASEPKPSKTLQMEMAMGRLAKLATEDQQIVLSAAKKAFAKTKNGDRITLSLEGGKSLKLRVSMKAQLVTFFTIIAEAQAKNKKTDFE